MVAPVAITSVSRPHEDSRFCADASVSAGPAVAVAVSLWVRFSFASKPESVSQNAPGTSRHSERRCRREHHRGRSRPREGELINSSPEYRQSDMFPSSRRNLPANARLLEDFREVVQLVSDRSPLLLHARA